MHALFKKMNAVVLCCFVLSASGEAFGQLHWSGNATGNDFSTAGNFIDEGSGLVAEFAPDSTVDVILDDRGNDGTRTVINFEGTSAAASSLTASSSYELTGLGGTLQVGGPITSRGSLFLGSTPATDAISTFDLSPGGVDGDLILDDSFVFVSFSSVSADELLISNNSNFSVSNISEVDVRRIGLGADSELSLSNGALISVQEPLDVAGNVSSISGTIEAPEVRVLFGGELVGRQRTTEATVIGDVVNGGTLEPGLDDGNSFQNHGRFFIEGDYQQEANGLTIFGLDSSPDSSLVDDQLIVTGDVQLDGNFSLEIGSDLFFEVGSSFVLIDIEGIRTGEFLNLPENEIVASDLDLGLDFRISYTAGDGNDVGVFATVTSVPEPNSISFLFLSGNLLVSLRRRKA